MIGRRHIGTVLRIVGLFLAAMVPRNTLASDESGEFAVPIRTPLFRSTVLVLTCVSIAGCKSEATDPESRAVPESVPKAKSSEAAANTAETESPSDVSHADLATPKSVAAPNDHIGAPKSATVDRSLESVKREILGAWDKIHSLRATISTDAESRQDDGNTQLIGEGLYECRKVEDRLLVRISITNEIVRKLAKGRDIVQMKLLTVSDGTTVHVQREGTGPMMVVRSAVESSALVHLGGQLVFDQFERTFEPTLLPDETLNGRPMFVIAGKNRGEGPSATYYFDKATGIMSCMWTADENGTQTSSVAITAVQIDPDIPDDRFEYTVPEGVQVMDAPTRPGS